MAAAPVAGLPLVAAGARHRGSLAGGCAPVVPTSSTSSDAVVGYADPVRAREPVRRRAASPRRPIEPGVAPARVAGRSGRAVRRLDDGSRRRRRPHLPARTSTRPASSLRDAAAGRRRGRGHPRRGRPPSCGSSRRPLHRGSCSTTSIRSSRAATGRSSRSETSARCARSGACRLAGRRRRPSPSCRFPITARRSGRSASRSRPMGGPSRRAGSVARSRSSGRPPTTLPGRRRPARRRRRRSDRGGHGPGRRRLSPATATGWSSWRRRRATRLAVPGSGVVAWASVGEDGTLLAVEVRDLLAGTSATYPAGGMATNVTELTADHVVLEATAFDPGTRTVGVVDRRTAGSRPSRRLRRRPNRRSGRPARMRE